MNNLVELAVPVGAVVVFILVVGLTIARLYRRASKEVAFVRTGVGGEKVVMNGGALVLPVFTLRLVLGGSGEPIRMVSHWLQRNNRLSDADYQQLNELVARLQQEEYSAQEARKLLFQMVKKSALGIFTAGGQLLDGMLSFFGLARKR